MGYLVWGRFILCGRVRSWDGMVLIIKEYRFDGRGRWLYRGYVVVGNKLVGCWWDIFMFEDMSGYEGWVDDKKGCVSVIKMMKRLLIYFFYRCFLLYCCGI